MSMNTVRVRFAPSPTGFLHVGGLRTALFNYLWARKNQGAFILRIEDTDRAREVPGATENIITTLKTFGLNFDEGPIKQSDRLDIYQKHIQILLDKGSAYKCYCTAERIAELKTAADASKAPFKYDKHCLNNAPYPPLRPRGGEGELKFVVRQNIPEQGSVEFDDAVYGHIRVENRTLDDGVLMKSDGWPVYNFANVVDDHDMNITHVIRGEEFISSTPKHILLYQAFGWTPPTFVHLPLLLNKERKKLSKRDGDVAVKEYLDRGYLPEALLNFISFLGWNPKSEKELFTLEGLVAEFDLKKINRAGAVFDADKLDWFNAQYLRNKSSSELAVLVKPYLPNEAANFPDEFLAAVVNIEKDRLKVVSEIGERVRYFFAEPEYDASLLIWKRSDSNQTIESLKYCKEIISNVNPPAGGQITKNEIEKTFLDAIGDGDKGTTLWPLRVALSGLTASPGPFEILEVFSKLPNGKEIILRRVDAALAKLTKL